MHSDITLDVIIDLNDWSGLNIYLGWRLEEQYFLFKDSLINLLPKTLDLTISLKIEMNWRVRCSTLCETFLIVNDSALAAFNTVYQILLVF